VRMVIFIHQVVNGAETLETNLHVYHKEQQSSESLTSDIWMNKIRRQ